LSPFPPGTRVPASDYVMRRIPNVPNFVARDLETAEYVLRPGALQWDEDGVSLHQKSLVLAGAPLAHTYDFARCGLVSFQVEVVDDAGGRVFSTPNADPHPLGPAHCSMTGSSAFTPSRSVIRAIRDAIIASCVWEQLPPAA